MQDDAGRSGQRGARAPVGVAAAARWHAARAVAVHHSVASHLAEARMATLQEGLEEGEAHGETSLLALLPPHSRSVEYEI